MVEVLRNLERRRRLGRTNTNVYKRRVHLGTPVNHKDYWELNRRRPSVIRRSMKSDSKCSSPREAILEPNFECRESDYEMKMGQETTPFVPHYPQPEPTFIHKKPHSENITSPSILENPRCHRISPIIQNTTPPLVLNARQSDSVISPITPIVSNVPQSEHQNSPIILKNQQNTLQSPKDKADFDNLGLKKTKERSNSPAIHDEPHLSIESSIVPNEHTNFISSKKSKISPTTTTGANSKKDKKSQFCCFHCKKRFRWFSHWQAHERTHTGERPYKCTHCDRCFTRGDGLQAHMVIHATKKPHKCTVCGKMFARKSMLDRHIVEHTGVIPYKCEVCELELLDPQSIEGHLLQHEGQKSFKCQYCSRGFINGKRLVRHIRGHTGEKPFPCSQCKMRFSKKSALVIHHRVHSGIKPFSCTDCGKSFSISGNLRRHLLIHTGEQPYECSKCKKKFNNKSHLARHVSSQHGK